MKILFTRFPLESAHGGAEKQTLSLMKGLLKQDHAIAFLGSCPILLEECVKAKIPSAKLTIGPPPVTKWGSISFLWRKKKMEQYLTMALENFQNLDAIVMLSLSEKLLATEWAHKNGIKVFWLEHDRIGQWLTKNPWLGRLRKLSALATTVTVSEMSRKIFLKLGWDEKNVVAIPNGVEALTPGPSPVSGRGEEKSSPFSRRGRKGPGDRGLVVGCIARLSPEKGINILIKAISDLPDVSLTIIGQGKEEPKITHLINQSTNQRINLIPSINTLPDFYTSLDALILPSTDNDPFGMVAAEAMMLGVPVIVTDQCGIAGYLENEKDAMIVPAGNVKALREAVASLSNAELRKRLGAAGQKTAQEAFSLEKMIDRYSNLISTQPKKSL